MSAYPALAAEKKAREYRIAQEELERSKPRMTSRGTRRTPTRAERLEAKGARTQAIEQTLASRRGYAPYIEDRSGVYMRLQQKPNAPKRGSAIGVVEPGVGEAYLRTAYPNW